MKAHISDHKSDALAITLPSHRYAKNTDMWQFLTETKLSSTFWQSVNPASLCSCDVGTDLLFYWSQFRLQNSFAILVLVLSFLGSSPIFTTYHSQFLLASCRVVQLPWPLMCLSAMLGPVLFSIYISPSVPSRPPTISSTAVCRRYTTIHCCFLHWFPTFYHQAWILSHYLLLAFT